MTNLPKMTWSTIGNRQVRAEIRHRDTRLVSVELTAVLPEDFQQDLWQVDIQLPFSPSFCWAPHLAPEEGCCIDQHAFRCPAMIASDGTQMLAVMPNLKMLKQSKNRWYMDFNAPAGLMSLGVGECEVPQHVLFRHKPGNMFPAGEFRFGFYIYTSAKAEDLQNPFRFILDYFWKLEGKRLFAAGAPEHGPLLQYCRRCYHWAFQSWAPTLWQSFEMDGVTVGAPAFIVNYTQSPNYPGLPTWRERMSVWNQAWFSSLRSASGLYRYACMTGDEGLKQKALQTKELALHMPQTKEGLFYSVVATKMEQGPEDTWVSAGWDTRFYGNSNRNPVTDDLAQSPFHLLDMSITASYMLRWYRDLEQDPRLLAYARRYAQALLRYQDSDGFFPAWITQEGTVLEQLRQSPETSASVTFLTELFQITGEESFFRAAQRGMEAVCSQIIPAGRWEDFEVFWSCCRWGGEYLGRKIPRSGMHKQCNLSMFWTAEALLKLYEVSGEARWLRQGQRVLDELLMTQAVWQPPYMKVPVFGGFGVMNCDGEWLDARQSLFAETIIQYGLTLKQEEYIQRGIAALRASFVMMYCPENPRVKGEWERRWPFFGEADYGFTMENYGHDGIIGEGYTGIGEFTIYDWGNGAASEAYMRISQKYGDLLRQYGD